MAHSTIYYENTERKKVKEKNAEKQNVESERSSY